MSVLAIDTVPRPVTPAPTHWTSDPRNIGQTLELSELRTYDAALETLGAYKLTGNFTVDLEIVLSDLRVHDKVTFDVKPKTLLSDMRQVEFRPTEKVDLEGFAEIMRAVARRIGAAPERPWWVRLFQ